MPAPALDKDSRRALLSQLAAKRQQQQQRTTGRGAYNELEDDSSDGGAAAGGSSDEEEESFATARSRQPVVLDDDYSEDENDDTNSRGATSRPAPGGRLRRLQKAGEALALPPAARQQQPRVAPTSTSTSVITIEDSDDDGGDMGSGTGTADDIAAQLGGLSIKARTARGGGRGTAAPRAKPGAELAGPASQAAVQGSDDDVDDSKCMVLGSNGEFRLNAKTSCMLYPHQVVGVRWLWSLYRLQRGGILADDMGLGKTIQCAAFLAGLIESKLIRRAVVVAPKTLLAQWRKELGLCGLGSACFEYGGTPNERASALDRVVRRRGVLLVTYGMVLHNAEVLSEHDSHDPDEGPMWDVMICDEGHKLKNPRMQLRKQLDAVPTVLRIIISGTPIQNNLLEMWALFNFCAPDVLGSAADFRDHFERVITNGSDKHATQYERERGAVAAARLRQEIGPYMLRREKKEVFKPTGGDGDDAGQQGVTGAGGPAEAGAAEDASGSGGGAKPASMPHKNDLIVWLKLKPMQRRVYQAFLNSDSVKKVFNQTASALAAITVLKKVCDHPALLSERAARGITCGASRARRQAAARLGGSGGGLSGDSDVEEIEDSSGDEVEVLESEEGEWESDSEDDSSDDEATQRRRQQARRRKQQQAKQQAGRGGGGKAPVAVGAGADEDWDVWASGDLEQKLLDEVHTTGFGASCKTVFVMALLKSLVAEGHRTLIFSQSRVMLNILESAIREEGWRFCRIDGSVASSTEREARVHQFQTSSTIPIFLLTSQVGGLGLTLTAADRVIILDPAWNPSTDNQSVDRAYRIGQKRDVVVYRLISCGTVEEKIYRRQVFKGGLARTGTEEGDQFRYFAQQDLRDLFRLELSECESSRTQRELHAMHAYQRRETPGLRRHLEYLASLECYAGVSDHDLLFSKKEREAPAATATQAASCSTGGWAGAAGGGYGASVSSVSAAAARGAGTSPRKGVFSKTANQGWSGGNELSDMFAKAVTVSGARSAAAAAVAATAQAPGSGWGGAGAAAGEAGASQSASPTQRRLSASSVKDSLQERIDELYELLERKRHLLTLSAGLADGGKRVRSQIAELEQELAEAKKKANGVASSSTTGTASGSSTSASAAVPSTAAVAAAPAAPVVAPAPPAPRSAPSGSITVGAPPNKPPAARSVPSSSTVAGAPVNKPAGGSTSSSTSSLLLAAAAAPLPGSTRSLADGAPPAAQPATAAAAVPPPAAPTAVPVAAAAAPAAPAPKPAASPLFARMQSMLWGGGRQQAAAVSVGAAAAPAGSGLSFGGAAAGQAAPGASSQGVSKPARELSAGNQQQQRQQQAPPRGPPQQRQDTQPAQQQQQPQEQPQQDAPGQQAQQAQQARQAQQDKPPRPLKETKAKLMEALLAIKSLEQGGYFDRGEMERLRCRAERLNRQYQEGKAAAAAASAATGLP